LRTEQSLTTPGIVISVQACAISLATRSPERIAPFM
jgi:hypothetical protein